ncbi:MAG TPA: hypothetical protein DDY65_04490 [Ruminococcaceae bacterium]|nr:hypothetical protein [Oscillospiraceae bacterium]
MCRLSGGGIYGRGICTPE